MVILKKRLHRYILITQIKGSTLVETLVAMIIVMLAFGIGLMIYLNVIQSSGAQQRLNAQLQMNQISIETKDKNLFVDDEYTMETMKIVRNLPGLAIRTDLLRGYEMTWENNHVISPER